MGVEPSARVDHDYDFAKGAAKWRLLERNRWATLVRCYPGPLLAAVAPALLATELALVAVALGGGWGARSCAPAATLARWLPRLLRERRAIQAHADRCPAREFADAPHPRPVVAVPRRAWRSRCCGCSARLLVGCDGGAAAVSVCALIVTFNRRDLLVRCIDAVLEQSAPVESLYVVDNASTDGTPELLRERGYLDRPELRYVRLGENSGSSGGFAAGIAAARRADADWLWVMDDDAEPAPDTLAHLLASPAAGAGDTAALCSAVVRPDGTIDTGHRGRFRRKPRPLPLAAYRDGDAPELDFFTFVGLLLPMRVARAADPPKAELFIWCDDYYSFRIREHGRIRLVPGSRMLHHDVGQAYSNRRSRFWNRLLGWSFVPTRLDDFWRNLCGVRNYVWIRSATRGRRRCRRWGRWRSSC